MSSRSPKIAIAVGLVAVFGAGIALIAFIRTGSTANDPPPPPPAPTAPAESPTTAAPSQARPKPTAPAQPVAGEVHHSQPTAAPRLDTPMPTGHSEPQRDENGKLVPVINVRALRAENARTDAPMQECVAKSGVKATGTATLGFTVAQKDGKLVLESSGVLEEQTLAAFPDLLECMHQTASAFAPVLDANKPADLGTPIYVRRHVKLDNGAVVENSIFNFSYVP